MSYDIRFGVKVAGAPSDCYAVIGRPEHDSPTYNLRDMFVACMDWDYHQGEWYPLMEVLPKIEKGVHELTFNRKKYLKYNPPNGWGDVDSALKALQSIIEYWKEESAWGWNGDIPKDCIYMRW